MEGWSELTGLFGGPEDPQFECDPGFPSGHLEYSPDSALLGDLRQGLSSLSLFPDL